MASELIVNFGLSVMAGRLLDIKLLPEPVPGVTPTNFSESKYQSFLQENAYEIVVCKMWSILFISLCFVGVHAGSLFDPTGQIPNIVANSSPAS